MQKDISTNAADVLAVELNDTYRTKTKNLLMLVKKQASEIEKRGQLVMKMEESVKLQQQNLIKLLEQNKHLESLVESLKQEREKMVEEIQLLKSKPKTTRARKKTKEEDVVDAA